MRIYFQTENHYKSYRAWLIIGLASMMLVAGAYMVRSDSGEIFLNLLLLIGGFMSGFVCVVSLMNEFHELDIDERKLALIAVADFLSDENFDDIPDDIVSILESRINALEDELNIAQENIRDNAQQIDNIQNPR